MIAFLMGLIAVVALVGAALLFGLFLGIEASYEDGLTDGRRGR